MSAVRRLISAVQNLPLRDDTQEAETLAAKVRARLPHSYDPVSLDGQAVQALSALVALCDSHGAAYLHTYAAEAAAELETLSRNKTCVNPSHLEPVTRGENVRRHYRHVAAVEDWQNLP